MIKQVLTTLKVVPLSEAVAIPMYPQYITDEGLFEPNESLAAQAVTMFGELQRWTLAPQPLRQV